MNNNQKRSKFWNFCDRSPAWLFFSILKNRKKCKENALIKKTQKFWKKKSKKKSGIVHSQTPKKWPPQKKKRHFLKPSHLRLSAIKMHKKLSKKKTPFFKNLSMNNNQKTEFELIVLLKTF